MLNRASQASYLGLLTIALGCAAFWYGGVLLTGWNTCLLLLGLVAIVYWLRSPPADPAPSSEPWLRWMVLLLPSYVALQLVPLPLFLLRILSPARAYILDNLGTVTQPVGFASLSIAPATTFAYLFRIVGYTLIFLLIRDIAGRSSQRAWAPVIPLVVIAALEAGLGLLQNASGAESTEGTYGSKNHFAGLLEMVLPLAVMYAIALFKRGDSRLAPSTLPAFKACAALSVAAVIFLGLLYSLSRMGLVAGLCGLFVMGALALGARLQAWKRWLALAGLAALFLLALFFLPPDELVRRFAGLSTELPARPARWLIWGNTLRLIGAYPLFGCGLGNYETAFLKYQTAVIDSAFSFAENDYLQLAAELGLVGFSILACLMLPIFRNALRVATHGPHRNIRYLALGCTGAMTAIAIHSLADFNTYIPANALVLAWISGISARLPFHPGPAGPAPAVPARTFFKRWGIVFSCLLIVYTPAWILFEFAFRSDRTAERLFCRFGICDTDAVLDAQTLEHRGNVAEVPTADLLEALRRDPNSPSRWCDLGEAMWRSGSIEKAKYCFSNALALGPDVPPVLMRAAEFYYTPQDDKWALQQTSRLLGKTDLYDDFVFNWYAGKKIAVTEILSHGLPVGQRASRAYFRYVIGGGNITDASSVWGWVASHGYADDRLAKQYVDFLVQDKRYETAAKSWALYLGARRNGYLESNWVFNGDFESEPSGSAFDWKIENHNQVEVARDGSVAHSGAHSLRIRFDGKENVAYRHIRQTAFVTPGRYRFEAYIRTQEITTDQGIGFHIYDPESPSRLDITTEQVVGTNDWRKIDQIISVPRETRLLEIQVIRQPTWRTDSRINGVAWIDSVGLLKLDAESPGSSINKGVLTRGTSERGSYRALGSPQPAAPAGPLRF